jgi:hypothetical protein
LLFFIGIFSCYRENLNYKNSLILFFILLLLFFTHPIGYITAVVILLTETSLINKNEAINREKGRIITYLLIIAPTMLLFLSFFVSENSSNNSLFDITISKSSILRIIDMKHLVVFSKNEQIVFFMFFFIILLNLANVISGPNNVGTELIRKRFMYIILFSLFVYFFVNDKLAGGSYLNIRITIIIYITIILFIGLRGLVFNYKFLTIIVSLFMVLFSLLIRYPKQKVIGEIVKDYLSIKDSIPEKSIVLPLSFNNHGFLKSNILSPRIGIFKHISGYLGAYKPMISMDNYEADTRLFPIRWRNDMNPYTFLSVNNRSGIESNPPSVNILKYEQKINTDLDYIVLWGNKKWYENNVGVKRLSNELDNYQLINESSSKIMWKLYKKNKK